MGPMLSVGYAHSSSGKEVVDMDDADVSVRRALIDTASCVRERMTGHE